MTIELSIDGRRVEAEAGATLRAVAAAHELYIPALCSHPDLPPLSELRLAPSVFRGENRFQSRASGPERGPEGCGLCLVELSGQDDPVRACQTLAEPGMSVRTMGKRLEELRRTRLMRILAHHPHACLTCAQREGCSLEVCSSNVPREERCCSLFHDCEVRRVAEYVGVKPETPRYRSAGRPVLDDEPLFVRNFELCIDCARCVRVCDQVRGVNALGAAYDGEQLVVGSLRPTLRESGCRFCGACVEVCPTGCLLDKPGRGASREQRLLPCVHGCPAGVDVPAYIRSIASGDLERAAALVWERLPLGSVLGHVCFPLCEPECRRGEIDEPLAINALKRFALEAAGTAFLDAAPRRPRSGRRVAIVGAGPAGLSAAYFLSFKGHDVSVFEATHVPGGMPALVIPDYRLPGAVVRRDVEAIRKLGVEIVSEQRFESAAAMRGLLERGFEAVLVAVGLPHSRRIELEGTELSGAFWGLVFLRDAKAGGSFELGEEVVVIGGGDVAIDVAMTARRLSGGRVRLYCLESREEMPAHAREIEEAEAEGIEIHPRWGPVAILGGDGQVTGLAVRRCVAVLDRQGRFAPSFDEQVTTRVPATAVIVAAGQAAPEALPAPGEGVFFAGDIADASRGGGSVVHAVASGRRAAAEIDRFLGGDGHVSVSLADFRAPDGKLGPAGGFARDSRVPIPRASALKRRSDFRELEDTLSASAAVAEAERCLQCDLRLRLGRPPRAPEPWLEFTRAQVERVPAQDGVYVLAGADRKPTLIKGTPSLRAELLEKLAAGRNEPFFRWEEDRMYTRRESELIQQHLKRYGELPAGGDEELDELF